MLNNRLLLSTSLYALSLALAPRAMASCLAGDGNVNSPGLCTIEQTLNGNSGTVVSGATLSTGLLSAYVVESNNASLGNAGTITSADIGLLGQATVDFSGKNGTLVNQGVITNTGLAGIAVQLLQPETMISIGSSGIVQATLGQAISMQTAAGLDLVPYTALTGNFINSGTILSAETAISDPNGTIVGNFTNSGLIKSTNLLTNGILLGGGVGGSLNNLAGGTISGSNDAIDIDNGILGGDLVNAGVISAGAGAVDVTTIAGSFKNLAGGNISATGQALQAISVGGSIVNAGTLSGATGIAIGNSLMTGNVGGGITNSGLIQGSNHGVLISAALSGLLGSGNVGGDFDNSGTITGLGGNPSLLSAVDITGTVTGNVINSGLIRSSGNGIVVPSIGGSFANLSGGTINAVSQALQANGVVGSIVNSGTISGVTGIAIGSVLTASSVGGGITNTGIIHGSNHGILINSALIGLLGSGNVGGDFNNSGTIIGASATPSLSDAVDITGTVAGNIINSGVINSQAAAVDVGVAGSTGTNSVTNSGIISGMEGFLIHTIVGGFMNFANGIITATLQGLDAGSVGGSVVNAGTISGASGIEIGGLLANGNVGGGITNTGLIISTGSLGNAGINAQTVSGDFVNAGTILGVNDNAAVTIASILGGATNSGFIDGFGSALNVPSIAGSFDNTASGTLTANTGLKFVTLGGTLLNDGHINGLAGQGVAGGNIGGGLQNDGSIIGSTTGLNLSGTVDGGLVNSGLIAGGNSGVVIAHNISNPLATPGISGDFNNSGTIIGTNGNPSLLSAVDIAGTVTGNVINSGLIHSAGDAVSILQAGASVTNSVVNSGTVIGSNGYVIPVILGSFKNLTGGIVTATGDALLAGSVGGSLSNAGTMSGQIGIDIGGLFASGNVGGSVTNTGLLEGSSNGILISGNVGGDFNNSGSITGIGTPSLLSAVDMLGTVAGNIINSGLISSAGIAVNVLAAGSNIANSIVNSGSISGLDGFAVQTIAGSFENLVDGIVTATDAAFEAGSLGGSITNAGTLSGQTGIDIGGGLATGDIDGGITNTGLIASAHGVLINSELGGKLGGDFNNSGSILSSLTAVEINEKLVGSFINSGLITSPGSVSAVLLGAVSGAVDNDGTIGSAGPALDLTGTVAGGITNTAGGVIESGGANAVLLSNAGLITLVNGGTISAGTGSAIMLAASPLVSSGLDLTNTGMIENQSTLYTPAVDLRNAALASTITQLSGTISNGIALSGLGLADMIVIDGGAITGPINDNFGGITSGTVNFDLAPNAIFTLQSGQGPLATALDAELVNINSGTVVMNGQIIAPGGVINNAVLDTGVPGVINANAALITGDYTQSPTATLLEEVSSVPNVLNNLNVTGNANLAGKLEIYFDPGTYSDLDESVVSATGTVGGAFATLAVAPGSTMPGTLGVTYGASYVKLTLGASPPPPSSPPTSPPVSPPVSPPTSPPVSPPVSPPTSPPVSPPVSPPTSPPVSPPVSPPTSPPVSPPTSPPVSPPVSPPTSPPVSPPVSPPTSPPVSPPVSPPTSPPVSPPVSPPTSPPVSPPVSPPTSPPVSPPASPPASPPSSSFGSPLSPAASAPASPPASPPASVPVVVAPQSTTPLAEVGSAAMVDSVRSVDTLLRHAIIQPSTTDDTVQLAFNDVSNPLATTRGDAQQFVQLGNTIPKIYAAYGAWLEATGNFANIRSSHGKSGYHSQTGGFLAGAAYNITPEDSLGVAVGYDHVSLSESDGSTSATDDIGRIALYGAHDFNNVTLSATGGLGYDALSTTRPLIVGTAKENHAGWEAELGTQLSRNMLFDRTLLVPTAGIDYTNLQEGSFHETGARGADLYGHAHGTGSLQPYVGMAVGQSFGTGGWSLTPSAHVTYRYEMLNTRKSLIVAAQDGTLFNATGIATARHTLETGAAIGAYAAPNLQVFAAYDVSIGFGYGLDQSVTAGMKYRF